MLIETIINLVMAIIDALISALPQLIDAGIQILTALIEGILSVLPVLISTIIELIMAILDALIGALPQIIDAGIQILMALIEGILQILPALIAAVIQLIVAILEALLNALPQILDAGVQLIQALIEGVLSLLGAVGSAALEIGQSIFDKISSIDLVEVGSNLIRGLWNGISDMSGWIYDKISGFASGITDKIKEVFGIHSPSRVMQKEVGKFLPLGVGKGIDDEADAPEKALLNSMSRLRKVDYELATSSNVSFQGSFKDSQTSQEEVDNEANYYFEIPVVVDGREIAKATATFTQSELDKMQKRSNRLAGVRA